MFHNPHMQSELLWRLNQTYSQRLGKARSRLELLHQLLTERRADSGLTGAVEVVQAECSTWNDEYRRWRYTYFYESGDERRMVQDENGIGRALAQLARMRQKHAQRATVVIDYLNDYRPDPVWTTVGQGDLWVLTTESIAALQTLEYA